MKTVVLTMNEQEAELLVSALMFYSELMLTTPVVDLARTDAEIEAHRADVIATCVTGGLASEQTQH